MVKSREHTFLAALAILLFAIVAYLGRDTLNPDGVAYFDLADAIRRGDWGHFVQAYWSPLYPALMAITGFLTGSEGADLAVIAHLWNAVAASLAAVILWHWARRVPNPYFARTAVAALLISSAGLPRIETVTPDVLLLAIVTWISYEIIVHQGQRWVLTGILFGLAFLAKTSTWPWLIVALLLRLWAAQDRNTRRSVLRSNLVTLGLMLLWSVPVSMKEGAPTITSATRLNYCWYLEGCDAKTPDQHSGMHRSYHDVRTGDSSHVTFATFEDAGAWTYAPWSDPTAWDKGVQTQRFVRLPFAKVVAYWLKLAQLAFALWELPLILGIVIPMLWVGRRPGMWRELGAGQRNAAVLMALGLVGLGEFVAVHVEPRLIAPFATMFALGALAWCLPAQVPPPEKARREARKPVPPPRPWLPQLLSYVGLVAALYFVYDRLGEGLPTSRRVARVVADLRAADQGLANRGISQRRVVILGPAIPVMATAYWVRSHIVAQILPRSAAAYSALPPQVQRRLLDSLFAGIADVAWITDGGGGMQIIPLFRTPPVTP